MKLALGSVQFGMRYGVANFQGRVSFDDARIIIQRAQLLGMDTLDTAINYGDSEYVLGQLGIDTWKTITKLPAVPNDCQDVVNWVHNQIGQSMVRLSINKFYGVLLHQPGQLLGSKGHKLLTALKDIKAKGITQKIGVSVYNSFELDMLFDVFEPDIVQAPLNILDREFLESGWATRLHSAGVEVHTRSVFLQGLLLMHPSQRPEKLSTRWSDVWGVWDLWLERSGLTALQACLRYVNNVSEIDRVIVGVDSIDQLNQVVEATPGELESLPNFKKLKDSRLINPSSWNQL
jgi:aryl-alcohol dehydrogenase-like predicted oxidoreductase